MESSDVVKSIFTSGNFQTLDWVIIAIYFAFSIGVGIWANRYVGGLKDYVLAGRHLGTALSVASMCATELSVVTVMYAAQKGFTGGFAAFHIALMAGAVTFFIGLTGLIIVPLRKTRVMTIPEYYEVRFGRRTRIFGGIVLGVGGILNMGLALKIASQFMVGMAGLELRGGIVLSIMVASMVVVLIYTVLGGMVSVVLTDFVQFLILSFGLLLATYLIWMKYDWQTLVQTVFKDKGPAGFDPTVSEGGFGPAYMAWQGVLGMVGCAIWPTAVSRILAARTTTVVRHQMMFSSLSFLIRFMIPYFLGIAALVFVLNAAPAYQQAFFPTDGTTPLSNIYALPVFLAHVLPSGLLGLVTAGMLAAFTASAAGYVLCWASILTLDIVAPLRTKKPLTDRAQLTLTRVFVVLISLYMIVWGLLYEGSDDVWEYMTITGAVYFTGAISLLVFGLYWKRASSTGAVLAILSGFSAVLGLEPVRARLNQYIVEPLLGTQLSVPAVGLLTLALSIFVMIVGSLLWPDRAKAQATAAETQMAPSEVN